MEKGKINDKIRALLASGRDEKITEAISVINEQALHELLPDMAAIYPSACSAEVKNEITSLFNNLKHKKAIPVLLSLIHPGQDSSTLLMLVSASWQCGLDLSGQMDVFVPFLLSDDFLLAFEAYTVIESNIDFMDAAMAERVRLLLNEKREMMSDKMILLYEGLIERLDSVS